MEDRCIVCGEVIPEGRQVCPKCESMTEEEAKVIVSEIAIDYAENGTILPPIAFDMAVKAIDAQIKLKQYIERINQPEYTGIVWTKDEVVMLLQELLADRS